MDWRRPLRSLRNFIEYFRQNDIAQRMERFLISRNDEEMLMQFIELTKNELSFMALGVSS